ncbi:MAG: hypothetical protein WA666_00270 [Nitrospirota bacterium]
MTEFDDEFQEIGHCGGKITFHIKDEEGKRLYSVSFEHISSSGPISLFGVYALVPQGIPVSTIKMGGIGQPWSPPPISPCIPVFIASDRQGFYGRNCPRCDQYFRTRCAPSEYVGPTTCAYCRLKAPTHEFLTEAHRRYIAYYVKIFGDAYNNGVDITIDMDAVANETTAEKPQYYYSEESQQTRFKCDCGVETDILGQYGFCPSCGRRNSFQVLENILNDLESRVLNPKFSYEQRRERDEEWRHVVKLCVSSFEGFARDILKFLVELPMTPTRKKQVGEINFHNPIKSGEKLEAYFGIDMFKGIGEDDKEFMRKRFLRRHIYEHNSGVADDDYISESGEALRKGQLVRERSSNVSHLVELVRILATNLDEGFHSIE